MKMKLSAVLALLCVLCLALAGCGSKEAVPAATEAPKVEGAKKLFAEAAELLILAGAHPEIRVVPGGVHNEASWERQIPFFMDVLFYNLP